MENITTVAELLGELSRDRYDVEHKHLRWWFRGHGKASYRLMPQIYRDGFEKLDEDKRLSVERHLTQDFRVLSTGLWRREAAEDDEDASLYFLQQHYGMRTRLLDWSLSPLAGLFFAVDNAEHDGDDGRLYVMDAYRLAGHQDNNQWKFGVATSRREMVRAAVRRIATWEDGPDFAGFTFPVRPRHFDRRIALQQGCFTFHVPARPELKEDGNVIQAFQIPAKAKKAIRSQLAAMQVHAFGIFGDLGHLAETLKGTYDAEVGRRLHP